jgi:predicted nucleic acid-binding protein
VRRGVIDTSVFVAGISGFKPDLEVTNPSAQLLRTWVNEDHFTWLISVDIIAEYKAVLARLGVRRQVVAPDRQSASRTSRGSQCAKNCRGFARSRRRSDMCLR